MAGLQLDGFDFGHEPAGVAAQERGHNAEHGVTEAADVQDVFPLRSLRRCVRLQVDAHELRSVATQPLLTWRRIEIGGLAAG